MRFRFSSRHFVRGETVPLHSHASAEAFCVLTGTIEFFRVVAGEQDRICCETGALMIVPPNALHALRNNTSQRGRLLGISTQLHRAFFDAVVAADKRRTFASLPLPEVLKLIAQFGAGTTCTS